MSFYSIYCFLVKPYCTVLIKLVYSLVQTKSNRFVGTPTPRFLMMSCGYGGVIKVDIFFAIRHLSVVNVIFAKED